MIGIVVPAHNEEALIVGCVRSILQATQTPRLAGELVEVVVVADACSDDTAIRATQGGAMTLEVQARNVGQARAAGADFLLARGARWLSFTDADTLVSYEWIAEQLALQADAVCGTVGVEDWTPHGDYGHLLRWHFAKTYMDLDEHRHIHGANLGVSAAAYRRAGGFGNLACSEDVALVEALQATGADIAWSAKPRVTTSARRLARASGGFAEALIQAVAHHLQAGVVRTASSA